MRIFENKTLTNEVSQLNFGIVTAGEKKQVSVCLKNETSARVIIKECKVTHPEVAIVEYPKQLGPNESATVVAEWSPSLTLKEGLKTNIELLFDEIYGDTQ